MYRAQFLFIETEARFVSLVQSNAVLFVHYIGIPYIVYYSTLNALVVDRILKL